MKTTKSEKPKEVNLDAQLRRVNQQFTATDYNVSYCAIPKVGTSVWRRIIVNLNGLYPDDDVVPVQKQFRLSQFPLNQIGPILQSHRRFLFVREPFTRLLSAFLDKFEKHVQLFEDKYGRKIIKTYRDNPSAESLKRGHDVTFAEFIQYRTDPETREKNPHWSLYYDLCHVCDISYDFIGSFENAEIEVPFVIKNVIKVNSSKLQDLTWRPSGTSDILLEYYSQVSKENIRKIYNIYKIDFELFGYSFPGPLEQLFEDS